MSILTKIFGDPNDKVIRGIYPIVEQVNKLETMVSALSDVELKGKTTEFVERLQKGETLDDILPEAFAVVREASKRTLGLRHYDVQLIGGVVLNRGEIAEMKTGEGKTLVATLAVYLNALEKKGVHVVTVNDYLARRDAVWMGQLYNFLGLSVASIQHEKSYLYDEKFLGDETAESAEATASYKVENKFLRECSRREAYAADITYGTNNEYGFDYLRDNMVASATDKVQRGWHYAIVDEVDSILIDEARTPLIISAPAEESGDLYRKFAELVPKLVKDVDYNVDEKMRASTLTEEGLNKVEKILNLGNIYSEGGIKFVHHLEQALKAHALFQRDKDYVVKDGEVLIIDEFTGRMLPGRRYSEGLHQAIEAKEGVDVQRESLTYATITFQNYFRLYKKLAGMTGTALTEAEEFSKIYNLDVTVIPTNKAIARRDLGDRIYATEMGKFKAVVQEIKKIHETGQPILVGTISIEKNEILSHLLSKEGVPHELLNAKQHEREASIVAQAGQVGAVTVATNMAGRGVDIILGGAPYSKDEYDKVVALGGLFVIGTERHESRRIDNQLRGRSGRQGDPGFSQFYVSMEDDLMRIFGSDRMKNMMQRLGVPEDVPIENSLITGSIEGAQRKVEGHNFDIRKHLVEYDDVINKQREVIYRRRDEALRLAVEEPEKLRATVFEMIEDEIEQVVSFHTAGLQEGDWNLGEIAETAVTIFSAPTNLKDELNKISGVHGDRLAEVRVRTEIIEYLMKLANTAYDEVAARVAEITKEPNYMQTVEKEILIRSIDNLWVEHLEAIDALRTGIGLRGYGQRDPLVEYKKESKQLFIQLLNLIQKQVVYSVFKVGVASQVVAESNGQKNLQYSAPAKEGDQQFGADPYKNVKRVAAVKSDKVYDATGSKVGRNDPCPCGSGKKFKKCHGA